MKQLIINGTKAHFFFNESVQNSKIAIWINDNLDRFDLNEAHSCEVSLVLFARILIRGDEDRVEIDIDSIKSLI
jgi:hypothetical protein